VKSGKGKSREPHSQRLQPSWGWASQDFSKSANQQITGVTHQITSSKSITCKSVWIIVTGVVEPVQGIHSPNGNGNAYMGPWARIFSEVSSDHWRYPQRVKILICCNCLSQHLSLLLNFPKAYFLQMLISF